MKYLDLGLWRNAECVCAVMKRQKPLLKHHELIRVATKYPNIAKDYFYNTETPDRRDYQN